MRTTGKTGATIPLVSQSVGVEQATMARTDPTTVEIVHSILEQAIHEVGDRASTYDAPKGEESMPKTIALFNRLYGLDLTVEQGWMFMVLLKAVRTSQGGLNMDNYVDLAAYGAFAGKAARDEKF